MERGKFIFGVGLGFVFLVLSCQVEKSHELRPVEVGVTAYIGEIASFVAKEKGYFEEEGLDVTIKVNIAGVESMRQLLAGKIDIAHSSETPFIYALLDSSYYQGERKGVPQAFANMILANKNQKIIASQLKHNISNASDLKGKKIGLVKNSQSEYHFDSFLLENKIEEEEVELINMQPETINQAIRNGEIDVAVIWEPHATQVLHDMKEDAVEIKTSLTYSTLWLAVALDSYAEENKEIMVAYLKALRKAQNYILEHPDYAIKKMTEITGASETVIRNVRDEIDYVLSLNERLLILLEWHQNWLIKKESIKNNNVFIRDYINYKPLEEAYPVGVRNNL